LEVPAHLPQLKNALSLAYALNSFGADHVSSEHDSIFASESQKDREIMFGLGLYETRPASVLDEEKVRFFIQSHRYYSILDTYNFCAFCFGLGWLYDGGDMVEIINAVTGWRTTFLELMLAGERRINMQRVFNLRAGITKDADNLPEKLFQPLQGGPSDGVCLDREFFDSCLGVYYAFAGWNADTGFPEDFKLKELSLSWLIQ
jgi:aldehyde:ferredoxin oxidoreductase